MSYLRHWLAVIILLILPVIATGAACSTKKETKEEVITLKVWGVWEEEDAFEELFTNYTKSHPTVKFEYKKLRFEEYQDELLSAWARSEGPDIFALPNYWIGEYARLIKPLPPVLEVPKLVTKKVLGCKKETKKVAEKVKTYTLANIRSLFIPPVAGDVIFTNKEGAEEIYGLPLAADNLALYYNRDILNQAIIPMPPRNWSELIAQVPRLVKENAKGEITQSAIALGAAKNIQRYVDLLSILMIQDGTVMSEARKSGGFRTTLAETVLGPDGKSFQAAAHALTFYTDFANPAKQSYTWNEDLPDSFEAFTQGYSAYYLGYAYHLPLIRKAAPNLNFDIAPLPQVSPEQEINYANYWIESVYVNSKYADQAWDFLVYASRKENVTSFLKATSRPAALLELIAQQKEEGSELTVFIDQTLNSTSWYHGRDYQKVEEAFQAMIEGVITSELTPLKAVDLAQKMINQNEQLKEKE